jgi:hypothetical protein
VGPSAGLDRCGKSRLKTGFDPQTVQPVVSRYTHYASPAHITVLLLLPLLSKCYHRDSLVNGIVFYCYVSCSASLVCAGLLNLIWNSPLVYWVCTIIDVNRTELI